MYKEIYIFRLIKSIAYQAISLVKSFYFSKYFTPIFLMISWHNTPSQYREEIIYAIKRLLRRFVLAYYLLDRTKTPYERFILRRKKKPYLIWLLLSEYYCLNIMAWRKITKHWYLENWFYMFFWLSVMLYYRYFIDQCIFINEINFIRINEDIQTMESYYSNNPSRVKNNRYVRPTFKYFKTLIHYKAIELTPSPFWEIVMWDTQGNHVKVFTKKLMILHQPINTPPYYITFWLITYTVINIYGTYMMWVYRTEMYNKYLLKNLYAGRNDYVFIASVVDDGGQFDDEEYEIGTTEHLEHYWWSFLTWIHSLNFQIPGFKYWNFLQTPTGIIWQINNQFLVHHVYRRDWWLKNEEIIIFKQKTSVMPPYTEEPDDEDKKEHFIVNANKRINGFKKWKQSRIRNKWPFKFILSLWTGK